MEINLKFLVIYPRRHWFLMWIFFNFIRRINLYFVVINPKKNKSEIPTIALGQFLGELNHMDNYCNITSPWLFFIKIVLKFLNYSDVWVQEDTFSMQSKNFVGCNPYHKQTMQPTLSNFTRVKSKRHKSANFHLLGEGKPTIFGYIPSYAKF